MRIATLRSLFALVLVPCASCASTGRSLQTRAGVLEYAARAGDPDNAQAAVALLRKCGGHALISFSFPSMEPDDMYVDVRENNGGQVTCMTSLYRNGQLAGAPTMTYRIADAGPTFENLCRLVARAEMDTHKSGEIFDMGKGYHVVTGVQWAVSSNRDSDFRDVFRDLALFEACDDDVDNPPYCPDCIHALRQTLSSSRTFASLAAAVDDAIGAFDDACKAVSGNGTLPWGAGSPGIDVSGVCLHGAALQCAHDVLHPPRELP